MDNTYLNQDRGDNRSYEQYLEAMDAVSIEKVASASTFFEPKKGNTLVDVGMASGTSTAILSGLFPQLNIVGVDINPKMVEIAQNRYQHNNLSFRTDDGEKLLSFETGSVNGFFNCSAIHHITSFNNYDNNRAYNTLKRQTKLLADKGVIVVRDFVKPEEKEIYIELSTTDKPDRPNDCDLLILFSQTARSLASATEQGFPVKEVKPGNKNTRRFQLYYSDAVEFIRRKDYYPNWEIELQEEYGYYTQKEFEEVFRNLGLRIIISAPVYNQWIINNRYKNQFRLFDKSGSEIGFPPTNYLIAGEKVTGGKQIKPIRFLPVGEKPFLKYSSFKNQDTGQIFDIVERPNEVIDILPFYKEENNLIILAKHGYPRPLVNIKTDSPTLDQKSFGGYISEGITIGKSGKIHSDLKERFNIYENQYNIREYSLSYYTSPGGINEKVTSLFIELKEKPDTPIALNKGFSGFRESGYIHPYLGAQLINTAQTGALVEARLELNIYHLFFRNNIKLPKWLGEKIGVEPGNNIKTSRLHDLLQHKRKAFLTSSDRAGFLRTDRAYFAEYGIQDSNSILEYVYPENLSTNTLITLPIYKKDNKIWIGVEVRDLPVPQIYSGNSLIITAPAFRLAKSVKNLFDLNIYLSELKIGKSTIKNFYKLGEKYFPSIGITTEQVYPYVVSLNEPSEDLEWINMDELFENFDKLDDAHLMICLSRLRHALQ